MEIVLVLVRQMVKFKDAIFTDCFHHVMWVIDKMAGAQNLIDEIDFVTTSKEVQPAAPIQETVPVEKGR